MYQITYPQNQVPHEPKLVHVQLYEYTVTSANYNVSTVIERKYM